MIQDIFIPTRIGSYYIFSQKIVGFEISSQSVQAHLISFAQHKKTIVKSMEMRLQDQNPATISYAIKKILTTMGSHDSVISCLSSGSVIYKELTVPFIGRDKIDLIIRYELEPFLPYAVDQAVIDFIITHEQKDKQQTTVLVAAIAQKDFDQHLEYFNKAGVNLSQVTVDLFAWYDFYRNVMYTPAAQTTLLFVDFGYDSIRFLYISKGILQAVRVLPYGLIGLIKKLNYKMHDPSLDNFEKLFEQDVMMSHEQQAIYRLLVDEFVNQLTLSLSFFEKQVAHYIQPLKIMCTGIGSQLPQSMELIIDRTSIPAELFDGIKLSMQYGIILPAGAKKTVDIYNRWPLLITAADESPINFLIEQKKKHANSLLLRQLIVAACLSVTTIIAMYAYTHYQLQIWHKDYEKSRKQMSLILKEEMDLDIKGIKRVPDIVAAAAAKLQQTKKVCLSFDLNNNNFLYYLEKLCTKIDREGLGLQVKKLSMQDKIIRMQASIEKTDDPAIAWKNLDTFTQELMDIPEFSLETIPAELAFTVVLHVKEDHVDTKDQS